MDRFAVIQNMISMEGFYDKFFHKKEASASPSNTKPLQNNELAEKYEEPMLKLATEIGNEFDRKMRSNSFFKDNYEIIGHSDTISTKVSAAGKLVACVIYWQEIVNAIENKNGPVDDYDDEASDAAAQEYSRTVNLDYYIKKFGAKAKAIHPSCTVMKQEGDVDMILLKIDPNA